MRLTLPFTSMEQPCRSQRMASGTSARSFLRARDMSSRLLASLGEGDMKSTSTFGAYLLLFCMRCISPIAAQSPNSAPTSDPQLIWNADAAQPQRFVAAHGEQAVVMGYQAAGLEMWAYPFQLLSGYRISILEPGQISPIDGLKLLRRIEYHPTEIVRVYIGPDFVVREHLFVPQSKPGAIITY